MATFRLIIPQLRLIRSVIEISKGQDQITIAVYTLSPTIESDRLKIDTLIAQYPGVINVIYVDEFPEFILQ